VKKCVEVEEKHTHMHFTVNCFSLISHEIREIKSKAAQSANDLLFRYRFNLNISLIVSIEQLDHKV